MKVMYMYLLLAHNLIARRVILKFSTLGTRCRISSVTRQPRYRKNIFVNEKDSNGGTPLCYAAWNDSVEVAELLLDAGADPKIINNFGIKHELWKDNKKIVRAK